MSAAKSFKTPDAVDLLIADHRRVKKLFKEFDKAKNGADMELLIRIVESACVELKIHGMLEAEFFYPAVRSQANVELQDLLNEADVEHDSMELLIDRLADLEPEDPMYAANFAVLIEYVDHHVKEEEKQLFPQVRMLKNLNLATLADEIQARKNELLSQIGEVEEDEGDEIAAIKGRGKTDSQLVRVHH